MFFVRLFVSFLKWSLNSVFIWLSPRLYYLYQNTPLNLAVCLWKNTLLCAMQQFQLLLDLQGVCIPFHSDVCFIAVAAKTLVCFSLPSVEKALKSICRNLWCLLTPGVLAEAILSQLWAGPVPHNSHLHRCRRRCRCSRSERGSLETTGQTRVPLELAAQTGGFVQMSFLWCCQPKACLPLGFV